MANVNLHSTTLRSSLSASVHADVHIPELFGDNSSSIGIIRYLKFGINGDAHNSLPSTCCKSWRVDRRPVPSHFFKLFPTNL